LALAEERRNLAEGRTQNTLRENAALKSENLSLVEKNAMVQADNTTVLREVLEEKQRIRKEVLALDAKMAHSGSLSYVQSLEDCTKNHCAKGTHRKYQAEKLATTAQAAYVGLCGTLLQGLCEDEIKKTNPYRDAMEVCRVLDMGSGQLNLSGIDMLRKGIEGDERGKVEYGGGWLTSKYYLQQAQERVHKVAAKEIPFQEIPTPDLDGVAFKVGDADDYSKLLMFILEMFKLDGVARDNNQPPIQLAGTLDGMEMSREVGVVIAGIKILDPRAMDPVSHLPIGG
jgi:hypothetical protein